MIEFILSCGWHFSGMALVAFLMSAATDRDDWGVFAFVALGASLVIGGVNLTRADALGREAFMAECLKDRKLYECQTMLGQARGLTYRMGEKTQPNQQVAK